MMCVAEVAQLGRALDSTHKVEGEAEDRVVACSNPALGTTILLWNKLIVHYFSFFEYSVMHSGLPS